MVKLCNDKSLYAHCNQGRTSQENFLSIHIVIIKPISGQGQRSDWPCDLLPYSG